MKVLLLVVLTLTEPRLLNSNDGDFNSLTAFNCTELSD